MLEPIAIMSFASYGLFEVNSYLSGWVVGWVGVGWVAGLNENITNSAKLGLTWAEFGNILLAFLIVIFLKIYDYPFCKVKYLDSS